MRRPDEAKFIDCVPNPTHTTGFGPYNQRFQWLPCEVEFTDGNITTEECLQPLTISEGPYPGTIRCRISSYINNLHPQKYKRLHAITSYIITQAVHLWNISLTPLPKHKRLHYENRSATYRRILYSSVLCDLDANDVSLKEPSQIPAGESNDGYDDQNCAGKTEILKSKLIQPEPGRFQPPKERESVDLTRDYKGLQIVVKLANIVLTPEKPSYEGGSWHIEGVLVSLDGCISRCV